MRTLLFDDNGACIGAGTLYGTAALSQGEVAVTEEQFAMYPHCRLVGGVVEAYTSLPQAKAAKLRASAEALAAKLAAGMPWSGATLQIDERSQARLGNALQLGQADGLPQGFAWRMEDNSALPLDLAGLLAMATAAWVYVHALRLHYWGLVDDINAAVDVAAVTAIDLEAGWS